MSSTLMQPERGQDSTCGPASLEITVLFTETAATVAALRLAAGLAEGLSARLRLLILHVVPYPLTLAEPTVKPAVLAERFRSVAEESRVAAKVDIRLCRDEWCALEGALAPRSLVVAGKRRGWWPRTEDTLIRKLRKAGHQVVRCAV